MKKAFTLVEILMVVAIIGLLSAVGVPAFLNSHHHAKEQIKEVNVDTVNSAKDQWALLHNKPAGTAVNWSDIQEFIGGGVHSQSDLTIDGAAIAINPVGTSASY